MRLTEPQRFHLHKFSDGEPRLVLDIPKNTLAALVDKGFVLRVPTCYKFFITPAGGDALVGKIGQRKSA